MVEEKKPLHKRVHAHIIRTAGVCNAWCRQWRMYDRLLPTAFLCGILVFLLYFIVAAPPFDFPSATLVKVSKGETIEEVAADLQKKHIIRSTFMFKFVARLYGSREAAVKGEYFFPGPQTIFTIGKRLARGDFELVPVRVTLPEGSSTAEMAKILTQKIADFDTETFLKLAQEKEGFLFPDTYFFLPGQEPESVLSVLQNNFDNHIAEVNVQEALLEFNKPLKDIIIMASLLEKEASDFEDKRIIAGILWKRISINMPLQVDAVFPYIIGKNSFDLTRADLKVDSPYNTYTHKGLPIGPITNPGIESILAAMTPVKTNYLYYLSDLNSQFHFSATYKQQLANQKKYLP